MDIWPFLYSDFSVQLTILQYCKNLQLYTVHMRNSWDPILGWYSNKKCTEATFLVNLTLENTQNTGFYYTKRSHLQPVRSRSNAPKMSPQRLLFDCCCYFILICVWFLLRLTTFSVFSMKYILKIISSFQFDIFP